LGPTAGVDGRFKSWDITLFCLMSSSSLNSVTQCNILEELYLQQHHCENLKSEAGSHTDQEENILALPGIKPQFLICPAHSLFTVLIHCLIKREYLVKNTTDIRIDVIFCD